LSRVLSCSISSMAIFPKPALPHPPLHTQHL
jgi:hypothetical protein